jgi:hypothetical protein
MVTIREVTSKALLKKFIDFPTFLYQDNPYFTPVIFEDELRTLNPKLNPASRYCDIKLFLAYKDNLIVGRVAAIINHYANTKYNEKRIRFNRIDFIDDAEVFDALIDAVSSYGKAHNLTELAGPLGFSDQDKEGLLTFGFEEKNMFVTFYTAAYYVDHFKRVGFEVDATWNEFQITIPKEIPEVLNKVSQRVLIRQNLKLIKVANKRYRTLGPYVKKIFRLMNVAYDHLYGYVPVEEDLMDMLAKQYIPLLNLDYVQVVMNDNDELVAFGLMVPSPVDALKKHRGHLFPFGFIPFLKEIKRGRVLDMLLVAVDPRYRDSGVLALVLLEGLKNAIKNKVEIAETGPELANNQHIQSLWKHFPSRHHKSRSAFIKKIT